MDSVSQTVTLWADEWYMAAALLACIAVFFYMKNIWVLREGITLNALLGITLAIVFAVFTLTRPLWHGTIDARTLLFAAFFLWCAGGTLFLLGRHTNLFKLMLGLMSEAGIIYTLFNYTRT